MKIVNAIQDLVEETLDHSLGHCHWLLSRLGCPMEFNYVPQVVFSVVKEEPHFSIRVRQEDSDQVDHVDVLKFTEELRKGFLCVVKDYLV